MADSPARFGCQLTSACSRRLLGAAAHAGRYAHRAGIFTWACSVAVDTPSTRSIELVVGDATLAFSPDEVAHIVERLASGEG